MRYTRRQLSALQSQPLPTFAEDFLQWSQTNNSSPFSAAPKGPSVLATSLIKSFFDQGLATEARDLFDEMPDRDVVAWTAMVTGYAARSQNTRAWGVFCEMLRKEIVPNAFTFSSVLKVCKVPLANQCFTEMRQKDLITWNTLISGYEKFDSTQSLLVFSRMESEGFTPNCFTFTSVTAACANLAVISCGQQVHGGIIRRGLNSNLALVNSLIDMYAKCGSITEAHKIFNEMPVRDLVSWTSMMIGYGAHGYGEEAVALFEEMVKADVKPDQIVFMAVLSSCSHAGLVDQGLNYFNSVMDHYKIKPNQEIYGCVVDLLGRAGRVEEAYELIQSMPFKPDESVWGALLSACKTHSLPGLAKLAALRVLDLQPNVVSTYVMLSNIYAAEGEWRESARMRKLMKEIVSKKVSGKSCIEVKNQVYSFVVGDTVGTHMERAYQTLGLLFQHMKEIDDEDEVDCLIHAIENGV
ncbi:unnamed protein product [Linum tenue]|uniref:Pentatricopeptide repeat-containing protein n=1 Tax=Linum tenue TaxID=586396 RepID=A0AAV0R468_9ROSI|nr:unnamed protein product [Linum tenue]